MLRPRRNPSQRSLAVSVHLQSYNTRSNSFQVLIFLPWLIAPGEVRSHALTVSHPRAYELDVIS